MTREEKIQELEEISKEILISESREIIDLAMVIIKDLQSSLDRLEEENRKLKENNNKLVEIAREAKSKTTARFLTALTINQLNKNNDK